jgi:hypothetical protein
MFDVHDHLDGLRCRETSWLSARRDELVREQRRLHVEELAVTRVLDERHALGPDLAARDGVSDQAARMKLATARALETLPEVAAAAYEGRLSAEQLAPVAQLADEDSDREWASRAGDVTPADLAKLARLRRTPTRLDGQRRRAARTLRKWWDQERGMLCGRFELPDLDGALVENVLDELIEAMRPAKGDPWDSIDHRGADALVQLCQEHDTRTEPERPWAAPPVRIHVQVPMTGPAELCGVPLPAEMVDAVRAQAQIELTVVDDHGIPTATGRAKSLVSDKRRRAVIRRDGHCRWPGCPRRLRLQAHHLHPASWGGSDDMANLASVCPAHHQLLIPHGDWVLHGNPNQPDGLTLTRRDDTSLTSHRTGAGTGAGARAGP